MTDKPKPSDILKARLASMAQSAPTPSPTQSIVQTTSVTDRELETRALHSIARAEEYFADPVGLIQAKWTKQEVDSFIFSRAVHEFSDYEAFVFKLVLVLAGNRMIDRDLAEVLAATAVYADGKAKVERNAPPMMGSVEYPGFHSLVTKGPGNEIPQSLSRHASEINMLIQRARNTAAPSLRTWVSKHIGAAPGERVTATSALFTDAPGPYTLPLGMQIDGRMLYYRGEASLLTIAPPGKGKTQCHVLPTLASYRGPAIVLDVKGECYDATAAWRRREVGPVLMFNPTDPERSSRYNPLSFVNDDPDELWESSRFLADLLVVVGSRSDPTWENHGKDLLTLIIAFVTAVNDPAERTMVQVLDLISTVGLTEMLEAVGDAASPFPSAMRRAAARFAKMASNAPKQFEGVLGGASLHMHIWEGPKLERSTAVSDWSPDDFRATPCPTLYLCIPPNAIETYAPVLRVIIGQHVKQLMRSHSRAHAPILFLLDELPRLGRMQPIRDALEVGRSYGIKLWMIAQYPEQILQAYPDVGDGMMESCDVRMYMNPSERTADKLARAFGTSENILTKSKKANLEATAIQGPGHRDSIFVLAANEQPQILRKRFFHHST